MFENNKKTRHASLISAAVLGLLAICICSACSSDLFSKTGKNWYEEKNKDLYVAKYSAVLEDSELTLCQYVLYDKKQQALYPLKYELNNGKAELSEKPELLETHSDIGADMLSVVRSGKTEVTASEMDAVYTALKDLLGKKEITNCLIGFNTPEFYDSIKAEAEDSSYEIMLYDVSSGQFYDDPDLSIADEKLVGIMTVLRIPTPMAVFILK